VVKLPDEILIERGSQAVDFRGEALTFKATTAGVLARLQHCLDLFNQSQDGWRRRLEREVEKRKKVEDLYRQTLEELRVANECKPNQQLLVQGNGHGPVHYQHQMSAESKRIVLVGGPDYQEGPHSTIGEDEFYDAVEAGLDKIDEEQQYLEKLKNKQVVRFPSQAPAHPLWPEVSCYLSLNCVISTSFHVVYGLMC
jgi:collagen type IV alpha-3-binding protein